MKIIDWNTVNDDEKKALLKRPSAQNEALSAQVKKIISTVKKDGDSALLAFSQQYDNAALTSLRVSDDEFNEAEQCVKYSALESIQIAIQRIENYQRQCRPKEIMVDTQDGIVCRRIPTPIVRVGLYVPGGTAPLLSTLMMLAIPANIAGCKTRVMCTPPNSQGKINPMLLVTAKSCGIDAIYKVGGAQAIAALAYGTESIPPVDKIVGPGNAWVTKAKQIVAAENAVSIDMPAGPSEVLVIADENANPEFVASDLLSQAEHGEDSQVILLSTSDQLAQSVARSIASQLVALPRKSIAEKALNNSRLIVVQNLAQAFKLSNDYAPEHLILQVNEASSYVEKIENAGAVFIGKWTPESMGDYINGANHVLPTEGFATRLSGLSVADFMKYISIQEVSQQGLKALGPAAMQLADIEGLTAHKKAIESRLDMMGRENP